MLRDSTENYRGGVRFEYRRFHVTLEQGGTTFKDNDAANYSGTNPGDSTAPILGQTLGLTGLQQAYGIRGSSIYSKALLTAQPVPWLDMYGQFLYSEPKIDVHYSDTATGNFVAAQLAAVLQQPDRHGTGAANQPHVTANVGIRDAADQAAAHHRIVDDRPVCTTQPRPTCWRPLFLQNPQTLAASTVSALNYAQVVNYNQQQLDILYDLGKLTLAWRLSLRLGGRDGAGRAS